MRMILPRTLHEKLEILERAGFFESSPMLRQHLRYANKYNDYSGLEEYLDTNPQIIAYAQAALYKKQRFLEVCPFEQLPTEDDFDGQIVIGELAFDCGRFTLTDNDLTHHVMLLGASGAGKSNASKLMLESIVRNSSAAVWLFDHQNEYTRLASHLGFTIIHGRDIHLNLFEPPSGLTPEQWLDVVAEIVQRESRLKTLSKNIVSNIGKQLMKSRGVLEGSLKYPTIVDFYRYIKSVKDNAARKRAFYESSLYSSLLNRFEDMVGVFNGLKVTQGIPIEKLQEENIIFSFETMKEENYAMMASLIISKVFFYRMMSPIKHTLLLCVFDEARRSFSADRDRLHDIGESTLNALITQARKYNIGFWLISQEPTSISKAARSNTYTRIVLPLVHGHDFWEMKNSLGLTEAQAKFVESLTKGQAVVRTLKYQYPFLIEFPLFDEAVETEPPKDTYEQLLRRIGYKPVYPDYTVRVAKPETDKMSEELTNEAVLLLNCAANNPFLVWSKLFRRAELGQREAESARALLEKKGLIIVHSNKCRTSRTKKGMLIELTDEAYKFLKKPKIKGKGGFCHKFYSHIVAAYLEVRGYKAVIEYNLNFNLIDVLALKGQEKIAYEITLSFKNLLTQIENDLNGGCNKVVVVVEDKEGLRHALALASGYEQVEFKIITEFM